ncbi:MAG: ferritin family protein [Myxococcota bacterium]|jgi:rubrerythrin
MAVSKGMLEILSTALGMEEKGMAFYREAVDVCANKAASEIFKTLHDDEVVHVERIRKIFVEVQAGRAMDDAWKSNRITHSDLGGIFRGLARKYGSEIRQAAKDVAAVDVGLEFELKSVSFYMEWMGKVTDVQERRFLAAMVSEEQEHHSALADLKFYLTDPAGWFNEKEHSTLDGA